MIGWRERYGRMSYFDLVLACDEVYFVFGDVDVPFAVADTYGAFGEGNEVMRFG